MKNKIRFAITALALVLFAACFFVACSDDVVSGKNNDHSYAEVLESNGAFVYKDKNYETLQDAIDAFAKDDSVARVTVGDQNKITVIGNAKTRGITIPEDSILYIDLNGFEVQFFDVDASAIKVGAGSTLVVNGGSFSLFEKSEELSVFSIVGKEADRGSGLVLSNLTIKADGQTAIFQDEYTSSVLSDSVVVNGATIARGGKENTSLTTFCDLPDVRMRGAQLVVGGSAVAVVTENLPSGEENEYIVSPTATIVDKTGGTIGPIDKGVCYIIRAGETFTFGSLREAIETLSDKGETIVLIAKEEVTSEEPIALSKSVTIDLNGYSVGTNNIVLADGVDLTIYGIAKNAVETAIPSFTGTITSDPAGSSSLKLYLVEMNSDIDVSRTVSADNSVFHGNISAGFGVYLTESEVEGVEENTVDITSAFGDIVLKDVTGEIGDLTASSLGGDVIINNDEATGSLTTGKIKAISHVTLTGSSVPTNEDASLAIGGTVELSGKLTSSEVLFKAAVSAGSVEDVGSTFGGDIAAKGALSFTDSYFDKVKAIESIAGGNIVIEKSYGSVDRVETKAPETGAKATASGYIKIDSSKISSSYLLAVGEVKATYATETEVYYGDITLKGGIGGAEKAPYLHVSGSVTGKDISAENCFFNSKNESTISGNTVHVEKSDFAPGLMNLPDLKYYSIVATGNDPEDAYSLSIASTMGRTADIEATNGSVCIDNDDEGVSVSLTTGNITAKEAVVLAGKLINETNYSVNVSGTVYGVTLVATSATVEGIVSLTGSLTSVNSVFEKAISAATVVDNGSTFKSVVFTNVSGGDAKFTGSVFASTAESPVNVTSMSGNIKMTKVSGTSGHLHSAQGSVTIDNSETEAVLNTGAIKAKDAVSIKGNPSGINVVVVAIGEEEKWSVKAATMDVAYATVKGKVELSGKLSSGNSVFEAEVSAASVKDNESCFYSNITATTEDVTLTGSTIDPASETYPAVSSKLGNIVMTGVSGYAGALTASSEGKDVTINNKVSGLITTGSIIAGDAVSLTGRTGNVVTAGAVQAVSLNASYAAVTGVVSLSGDLTSANSVFESAVSAKGSILDEESTFAKDVTAEGNVILTNTAFEGSPEDSRAVTSTNGDIEMTNVTGQAGMLKASNVTVSNYAALANLETGAIEAVKAVVAGPADVNYKVTVGGVTGATLDVSRSTVTGAVTLTGGMTSKLSVFGDDVKASTVFDNGSTFNDVVYTEIDGGDAVFDSSKFTSENANVLSSSGNIIMTGVTGTAGDLKSSLGWVTIDNSEATASLSTGSVEAAEAVSIKGKSSDIKVVARLNVKASTLDTVYATVNGTVTLSGDMTSAHSVFMGDVSLDGNLKSSGSSFAAVSANAVIDSISLFAGNITAVDDVSLTGSAFESNAGISSTAGNILLTEVTGNAGDLSAPADGKNVTIDNAKALAALKTGKITAGDAVAVTGSLIYQNSEKVNSLTVGGVYGKTLDASYAILDGAVELSGNLKSGYSVFTVNGDVSAFTVVDSNSTVKGDITAEEDATFENTVFDSTLADIISTNGNILMTKATGEYGTITASTYGKNVTIDNAKAIGEFKTAKITAGNAVTVTGNSDHYVDVNGVSGTTLDAVFTNFLSEPISTKNGVTINESSVNEASIKSTFGSIEMTNVTGTAGNLEAYSVTIDNSEAKETLTTGAISTTYGIKVTGNHYNKVTVGSVSKGSTLDVVHAILTGSVSVTGDLVSTDSEFKRSVTAATITDTRGTFHGSDTNDVITAVIGDVKLTDSKISVTAATSENGVILMTNVTNAVADTASGKLTASSVTINNSQSATKLKTGVIEATDSVTVKGRNASTVSYVDVAGVSGVALDVTYATISGDVQLSGNLKSAYSVFSSTTAVPDYAVSAYAVVDEGSTFKGSVTATTGDVTLTGSKFENAAYAVTSLNGSIGMTKVIGSAGDLKAHNIVINNAQATSPLTIVSITADGGAVTMIGNDMNHSVTVNGNGAGTKGISAKSLDASYSEIKSVVSLTGKLTSSDSIFNGTVDAGEVVDERSSFDKTITATTGDVILTGSKLNTAVAGVTSEKGNIVMTNVTKATGITAAGNLKAYSVTINNAEATEALVTGSITADGSVSVTGNSYKTVTVGAVEGSSVKASVLDMAYATVNGAVTLSGNLTSSYSTFSGTVTAASVEDERSAFGALITATTGDVTLTGSKLNSTAAGVTSVKGNIVMTNVTKATGISAAGNLTAFSVTIDNAEATEALAIGSITADGAVTVAGNSYKTVTVGAVSGSTLDATYATVGATSSNITVKGKLTSTDSTFNGEITAASVEAERGAFSKAITAKTGDIILTGSTISSSAAVTSVKGDIEMTKVTGTAGNLEAYSVAIDNAQATDTLTTGVITADGAVSVTGNAGKKVTVGGVANASTLDTVYATVTAAVKITGNLATANSAFSGAVTLKGDQTSLTATDSNFTGSVELTGKLSDLTSENSTFDDTAITGNLTATDSVFTGSVNAATVTDTRGVFKGANTDAITATTGDVVMTESVFDNKVGINAQFGSITMTKVSGTAGALEAYKVNINNAQSTVVFETGAITAVDAVTVTGNANRQVIVAGSITGTTLVANYANLMGSINTKTSVTASNCTVGDGTTDDDVTSASVSITGSRIMLDGLVADSVTITSPVNSSSVASISAKNLSVTADNDKFSVGTVSASRMISIAGGTFGDFTFSGSANSTISAGVFSGAFLHNGSATLAITGGFFTNSQTLSSGVTTINGTYDTTPGRVGWNLTFKDLDISNDCLCYIQSGYFEAANESQLNNLGENVSQSSGTSTKFVDIVYTKSTIGSGNPTNLRMADAEKVKKVIVTFGNNVDVTSHLHFFYPTNVELKGSILLDSDAFNVYSYYRKLDDSSDESIVWKYNGSSYSQIEGAWDSYNDRWKYVF